MPVCTGFDIRLQTDVTNRLCLLDSLIGFSVQEERQLYTRVSSLPVALFALTMKRATRPFIQRLLANNCARFSGYKRHSLSSSRNRVVFPFTIYDKEGRIRKDV